MRGVAVFEGNNSNLSKGSNELSSTTLSSIIRFDVI